MRQQVHSFRGRLTELLRKHGSTPDQAAQRAGLSEALVADLLKGRQVLTGDVAFALAGALELSPLVLLELQRESCLEARDRGELRPTLAV